MPLLGVHLTVYCLLYCILQSVKLTLCSTATGHQMPLLGVCLTVHCLLNCFLQNVKLTLCSTALGHQMPLLGVHMTVHCLCNCMPQHVKMTLCSTVLGHQMPLGVHLYLKIWTHFVFHALLHRGLFYERPINWCNIQAAKFLLWSIFLFSPIFRKNPIFPIF